MAILAGRDIRRLTFSADLPGHWRLGWHRLWGPRSHAAAQGLEDLFPEHEGRACSTGKGVSQGLGRCQPRGMGAVQLGRPEEDG